MAVWNIYGYLVYIFPFWHVLPRTIWQPCLEEVIAVTIKREKYTFQNCNPLLEKCICKKARVPN
jgi:hypothetical protein